jgi:hypothetical protein
MQVLRLTFDLLSISEPYAFKRQLEIVEQLQLTDYRLNPQLRLEYAILLFQNARETEGDKVFRSLRDLWKSTEQFVQVPDRLRWLRSSDARELRVVQATVASDFVGRVLAKVPEFGGRTVPLRPEEHGFREVKPGLRFACHVSFGHNGPFLRPVTAGPAK